jgi:sugar phosphate isomerase/epimerase
MTKAKIGLIGLVGEEAKADYWGTMQRVAAIGYQGIEGAGELLRGDVAENVKRFHDLGLQVLTTSASRERLRDNLEEVVAEAKALQTPRVTVWWAPCDTRESVLSDAELYNQAGERLAGEEIKLCYHHHEHEFRNAFNGVQAMDILAEHTDPKTVFFELDIAWITFGGEDPVNIIQRLASRVPAIHVKDLYGLDERGKFTTVGTGVVKIKESVQAAIDSGIEWAVIEQDKLRNLSAFETITVSYLYLKENELV